MKYYLIAGEASGDLHGAAFVKALRQSDPAARIRCWGGNQMEAAGALLVKHYKDLAFMGFWEVVKHLPTILRNINFCKKDILAFAPDVLVLIDYPGFNLRLLSWAKKHHLKIAYYISPQVWAWQESRVASIKKFVDTMMVILPFEKPFYARFDFEVHYVGHPLAEVISNEMKQPFQPFPFKNIIAILPGSRVQEIKKKLPIMLQAAANFPQYPCVVAQAPSVDDALYQNLMKPFSNAVLIKNETYQILRNARAALVTSGTATLETALFNVPQVVCYKGSWLSYLIAKYVINIKFIALVNIILNKKAVTELIQNEMNTQNLKTELEKILNNESLRAAIQADYYALQQLLKTAQSPPIQAAQLVYSLAIK